MKFLGRVLFGFVILIIGLNVFTQSRNYAYTKSVGLNGDAAVNEGNYDYFRGLRGYYLIDDVINETINLEEISFNLHAFLQSNGDFNVMTVVVDHLEGIDTQMLNIKVTGTGGNFEQQLVKLSEGNWFIQYIFLENLYVDQPDLRDDILDVSIWYVDTQDEETIVPLYDYDETQGPLLSAKASNLAAVISGLNHLDHNPSKTMVQSEAIQTVPTEQTKGTSKTYKDVIFRVKAPKDVTGDAYISGNFNNWAAANSNYKLTYNETTKTLEGKFDITTDYTTIQYQINFPNNLVEVDADNNVVLHTHTLLTLDNVTLSDYNIVTVESGLPEYKFNEYNWVIWRNMGIFALIFAVLTYLLFFRKKQKKTKNVYVAEGIKKDEVVKKQPQNLNLKQISDVEERDKVYEASQEVKESASSVEVKTEDNQTE